MAYPQDLSGKYIAHRIDVGATGKMDSRLANGVLANQTTRATVAVYTGDPPPRNQQQRLELTKTQLPFSFTWLKYCAGYVTTAPLASTVMTGPMTGCYLCRYKEGGTQIAHIGTAHGPDDPKTIDVKRAWLSFVERGEVSGVTGGSPADYFSVGEVEKAMSGAIPTIVGCFSGTGAYAILLAPVRPSQCPVGVNQLLRVADVKKMTLQPWATIAAMRRFRV
jgi:hypothetical protein